MIGNLLSFLFEIAVLVAVFVFAQVRVLRMSAEARVQRFFRYRRLAARVGYTLRAGGNPDVGPRGE